MVSSGGKSSQSQATSQSLGLGLFNTTSGSAPNDEVCIANGQPVSGDFKRFLEDHPDMDFYEAKRKFKEEQKAKQRVHQGPKLH
ncbi:MAG: hypothetical protein NC453_23925 [Muribaculum sp.]|nr:hypothetical protein [Muribaculum sp.]